MSPILIVFIVFACVWLLISLGMYLYLFLYEGLSWSNAWFALLTPALFVIAVFQR